MVTDFRMHAAVQSITLSCVAHNACSCLSSFRNSRNCMTQDALLFLHISSWTTSTKTATTVANEVVSFRMLGFAQSSYGCHDC